jgi:hypothetical protein
MRTVQGNVFQSLRAVAAFLDANASAFPNVVASGSRKRLDEIIAALSNHVATQSGSELASQGATRTHHALRRALVRDHMTPVARIARLERAALPVLTPFRIPNARPTAERLAAAAYGMAEAAAEYSTVFVAAGLPDDFIERLTAAADAMLASLDDRTQSRGARGGATQGLKTRLAEGRRIVAVLDALVTTALRDDPALLASWNVVKRVKHHGARTESSPWHPPSVNEYIPLTAEAAASPLQSQPPLPIRRASTSPPTSTASTNVHSPLGVRRRPRLPRPRVRAPRRRHGAAHRLRLQADQRIPL